MAVIRIEKTKNYTVMSNVHIDDPRLSLRAIGLLSRMLRQPDDWDYSVRGLAAMCKEGRDAVAATLNELIEAGYVVRTRTHKEDGSFGGIEYVVYEAPQSPRPENTDMVTLKSPRPENPYTDNPNTVNPPQPNTINHQNTINIPPYNPPTGGPRERKKRAKRGARDAPDWKPERFQGFWEFYPAEGRRDKQGAMDEWDKLKPSDELIKEIGKALRVLKESDEWKRGIGIPYAVRFLRRRRWEDASNVKPASGGETQVIARRYVRTEIVNGKEVDIYE